MTDIYSLTHEEQLRRSMSVLPEFHANALGDILGDVMPCLRNARKSRYALEVRKSRMVKVSTRKYKARKGRG